MDAVFLLNQMTTFALVLLRVIGILSVGMPFGSPFLPAITRVLIALGVAMVLVPLVEVWPGGDGWAFAMAGAVELATGLAIGLMSILLFLAVQGAGDLIDIEMGFGMVHVIDPQFGQPVPLMGTFLYIVAVIMFLTFDGHHHLLRALADSFQVIPPGTVNWNDSAFATAADHFGWVIVTALRLALPVLGLLFLTNVMFAILARTMPQLHVLVVGMPAKIAVGMIGMLLTLPALKTMVEQEWLLSLNTMVDFIRALVP
ncbi:MAG: flagellar biosynthetic protein FliR [Thermaerobacterales bacterium]